MVAVIRRLALAALVGLGLTLIPAGATSAAPADDIHALVNQARWANGQAGLIRNPAMDQVAADWAATMAANGTMAHNPDYTSQIPGGWTAAAENVAHGHPTGTAMHDGWMGSSGHRANILGDFTDIGIAFLSSGGTTWGVEVFGRYPGHVGPAAPAPPPPPAPAPPPETAVETVPPTPTPTATPTATPSPSPSSPAVQRADAELRTVAGAGWPPWALIAAVLGISAAAAATVVRRRSRHGRRARR
jgi:hypothetical protein